MIRKSQHRSNKGERWLVTLITSWQEGRKGWCSSESSSCPDPAGSGRGEGTQPGWGWAQAGWGSDRSVEARVWSGALESGGFAGLTPWEQAQQEDNQHAQRAGHTSQAEAEPAGSLSLRKRRNGDGKHLGHSSRSCKCGKTGSVRFSLAKDSIF